MTQELRKLAEAYAWHSVHGAATNGESVMGARDALHEAIEALMERLEKAEKELSFLNGDLLYWTERAVGKGNANSDIEEAWERYEAFQRAAMEASK